MNAFQRKAALRIFSIHVGVVGVIMLFSGLKGCFRPKPKKEIITFVDFGSPAPPVAVQEVEQMQESEPEPPAPEPPAPQAAPAETVPEPVQQKKVVPKPKTETPKPKPKQVEPEKPKWKPTPVDQIKVGKKIEPVKKEPVLTQKDFDRLKNAQSNEKLPTSSGAVGNPDADAAYIAQIGRYFDQRWSEPANASPASSVVYRIYISQWGTITKRTKIQGSGDAAFDASVKAAVNSVGTAPKPPAGFPYDYVEVEFRIRN